MVDVTSVVTAFQGIKLATDIVQKIRKADKSLENAEQKLVLADLVSTLADAKIALSSVQEDLHEKDQEISRLQSALILRKELVRCDEAYYESTDEGYPKGAPYCSYCFEIKGIAVHTNTDAKDRRNDSCPSCKNKTRGHQTKDGKNPNK